MTFGFHDLDQRTRELMLTEIQHDAEQQRLDGGTRLNDVGRGAWERLLAEATEGGSEATLAAALGRPGGRFIKLTEPNPQNPGATKQVPITAGTTLAEGEFNRFYIRAVCQRAITEGFEIEVYRARPSNPPDSTSQAKIGTRPDPHDLLADLRTNIGVATALGLPPHPNSGLSIRQIETHT